MNEYRAVLQVNTIIDYHGAFCEKKNRDEYQNSEKDVSFILSELDIYIHSDFLELVTGNALQCIFKTH